MEQMRPSNDLWRSMGAADRWPAEPADADPDTHPITERDPGRPGSLSLPAPSCPTSTPTTGCSRAAGRARRRGRAGASGTTPRRLGRLRPRRAPLAVGLRAAPRRVRRLGAHACPGWRTRPTWSPGTPTSATCASWPPPACRSCRPPGSAGRRLGAARRRRVGGQAGGQRRQHRHRPLRPGRPGDRDAGRRARRPAAARRPTGRWSSRTCAAVDTYGETALLYSAPTRPAAASATPSARAPMLDRPGPRRGGPVQGGGDHARACRRRRAGGGRRQALAAVPAAPTACCTPGSTSSPARTARRCWWSWSSPSRRCSSATAPGAADRARRRHPEPPLNQDQIPAMPTSAGLRTVCSRGHRSLRSLPGA